jgi:purine-binding chemotaxis protein CheW
MAEQHVSNDKKQYLSFRVCTQNFAIPVNLVEVVVEMVHISPLAKAPDFVAGMINFHGEIIPVIDMSAAFNIARDSEIVHDKLIITATRNMQYALWVTDCSGLTEINSDEIKKAGKLMVDLDCVQGIFEMEDASVLLYNPEAFFTADQLALLKKALENRKQTEHKTATKPNLQK